MKHFLGAVSVAALLATSAHAAPTEYTFSSGGWTNGGIFSGIFMGEDLDGDFQINSLNGEVTEFFATYTDDEFEGDIVFSSLSGNDPGNDFPTPPGALVFTLDGSGTLGDDTYRGIEGISVSNGFFAIDIGPGPQIGLCDTGVTCGIFGPSGGFGPIEGQNDPIGGGGGVSVFSVSNEIELVPVEEDPRIGFVFASTTESVVVTGDIGSPLGTEDRPFFPDFEDDGSFVFQVPDRDPGEIFFIDPVIAVGYTYVATGNEFTAVQAPSLAAVPDADGEYTLAVNGITTTLQAGESIDFATLAGLTGPVTEFTITGIDTGLELDPSDPLAFQTGIAVATSGVGTVSQTPITIDTDVSAVPLPAGAVLLLTGMGGLMVMRRRRKHA